MRGPREPKLIHFVVARGYENFESAARCIGILKALRESTKTFKIKRCMCEPFRNELQQAAMRETTETVNFAARALANSIPSFGHARSHRKLPSSRTQLASSKMNARATFQFEICKFRCCASARAEGLIYAALRYVPGIKEKVACLW